MWSIRAAARCIWTGKAKGCNTLIYVAAAGADGPVAVTLFGGTKPGLFSGTLSEGKITTADLSGPLASMTISDLVDYIKLGRAHVNVHTSEYPNGIIRGQIKPS